jgi:hypothetical protein
LILNSSGWLSVVPRNCRSGSVPALPPRRQKVFEANAGLRSAAMRVPSAILSEVTAPGARLRLLTTPAAVA